MPGGASSTASRFRSLVEAHPGITIRQAARSLGLSHATSTYHLGRLARENEVTRVRDGREVRFFPRGQDTPSNYLRALLADPRKRRIIESLRRPGASWLTLNEMAGALGVRFGFLKRTLMQLERSNLVHMERRNTRYLLHALEPLLTLGVAAAPVPVDPLAGLRPQPPILSGGHVLLR